MAILDFTHYDMVRAALGLETDETVVSDETIALPIFQGAAEMEIAARDPLALTRTGTDAQRIINATVYITAALIAPTMTQLKRESFGDYSYASSVDWAKRAKDLRMRADSELNAILKTKNWPTMFAVASGGRGL